jgi:two-component system, LytTR family, response regulator
MIAAIVEDEQPSSFALETIIKDYCPQVQTTHVFSTFETALTGIEKLKPDIIFLDILLGAHNGFDLLPQLSQPLPKIIFTTAFDAYAIKAFKISAVDYLLKPIGITDLQNAINKVIDIKYEQDKRLKYLLKNNSEKPRLKQIAMATTNGFTFVEIGSLVRFEADGSYTKAFTTGKETFLLSHNLKFYEEILEEENFFRVHHHHLVNLNQLAKYVKGSGGYVIMKDGSKADVAQRRKEDLMQKLGIH